MDVRMPDGTIISNVPDNITQEDLLARFGRYNALNTPNKPVTLREAATGGAKRMLSSAETGLAGMFGAEEAAKAGQTRQEDITERSGADLQKVKDAYANKGLFAAGKEAISQIPTAVAEQFPNLATTIAGGRAGAALGALGGPFAEFTVPAGALLGAAIPSYFQQAGTNLERQAQEKGPISGEAAYGAAVPQAALDVFTDKILFSRLLGMPVKHLGKEAAEAAAKQSLISTLGKGTAKGIVAEVPTEVAQQMFERMQAGLSLTNDEARKEYADTAYQVALLGPLGAIGSVQERGEAKNAVAAAQEAEQKQAAIQLAQDQRQATGVMEQQPMFTQEQAPEAQGPTQPIPEPTTTLPTFGFDDEGKFTNAPATEVSPDQTDLFTARGKPTPDALASVEAARVQGLPAKIAELAGTPEGRAELSSNRKMYFPDLTTKERNAKIVEIQRAGVAPVVEAPVAEGTLTPAILKSFDITPRNKQYKALEGANLTDPTTYNLLTTAAAAGTDFGVKANRILDAYPHYNPNAAQRDLYTGEINAPQTQAVKAKPEQQDLFGLQEDGTRADIVEQAAEPSVEESVRPEETPVQVAEEPVGRGVEPIGQPADTGVGQPELPPSNQPSALAAEAAAALKKEPVATAWTNFTYPDGTPFPPYATLSKLAKNQIKDAHDDGYLSQAEATQIMRREKGNLRVESVNKPEMPIEEGPDDSAALAKALSIIDAGIQQRLGTKQNIAPEEAVSMGQILSALGDIMYILAKRGVKSLAQAMTLAKKELGTNADKITDVQYKQAFKSANERVVQEKTKPLVNPQAQAQAQQAINAMSGTLAQSGPKVTTTPTQVAQNIATTMIKNPTGALGMIENLANKIRTAGVDKAAYLATSIQDHNDGAFRDINGNIRQDMGLSAANNMQNYINAIFTHGGIEILSDKAIRVKTDKHSIDGVFRAGKKLADRIGVDEARKLITGAFYHYRADAIMKLPKTDWPKNWLADPRMVPTPMQIKAGLDAFKQFPELEEMRTQFIGSKNQMVKFLFDAGFLSKGKRDAFLADNSYAPWLRLKEYSDTIPGLGNMGRMVDLSQMKALVGGTEEVNDMLENMAQIIGWFARSGIANHTANQALEAMVTMNSAKKFKTRPGSGDPSHTVMTYVDGIPTFWQIDNPYDLAAFQTVKGLDSPAMRTIGRALGTLRAGIVLFPAFPLRQVIMDSQRAFVQSGVEHPWPMMGKIFKTFLSGEAYKANAKDIETLRNYGVVGGIDFNAHDTTRGRAKQFGLSEPGNTLTDKWMRSPAYQFLHTLAYSADLSVRLGIFRQTMEETGDEVLAATRAREIINFQKSGTSELLHTLKQTIPFLGAYLQGMDVNYRSMIGRGNSMKARKAAAAAYWGNMAMYAGLVVAYTMCMSGDDEYEDQKGFITDRNFLIPGVGLLPVPTDVGFLGKVIPERITDYILQEGTEDPESAKRLRSGIIQAAGAGFLPPMAVYGVTPALELVFNKSFFSDMPIVGQYYQGLENKEQYTPNTSGFARAVGEVLNQSPLQIDYVLNAIGGTSAGAILQLADVMAGDGKMAADRTPIISTFQMKTVGGRYAEEYYAVRELTEQAYKTQQAMAERGDTEGREEYLARPEIQARLGARPGIEAIHTQLNAIQHQRKAIENSDLDPQAKRDAVNALLANVEANLKAAGIREKRVAVE